MEEQPQLHSHRDTNVIYGSGALTENGRFPSGTRFKETAARHVDEQGGWHKVTVGQKWEKRSRVGERVIYDDARG